MTELRYAANQPLTIGADLATALPVDTSRFAGGLLLNDSGAGLTLHFYAAPDMDTASGDYRLISDGAGVTVAVTVPTNGAAPLPDQVFAASVLRIVGASGSGAARVSLKS